MKAGRGREGAGRGGEGQGSALGRSVEAGGRGGGVLNIPELEVALTGGGKLRSQIPRGCGQRLLLLFRRRVVSRLFPIQWTAAGQASLSLIVSWSLPKFMFIESVMQSSHLI